MIGPGWTACPDLSKVIHKLKNDKLLSLLFIYIQKQASNKSSNFWGPLLFSLKNKMKKIKIKKNHQYFFLINFLWFSGLTVCTVWGRSSIFSWPISSETGWRMSCGPAERPITNPTAGQFFFVFRVNKFTKMTLSFQCLDLGFVTLHLPSLNNKFMKVIVTNHEAGWS